MTQPDSRFQRNLVDTGLVNGVGIGYYTQRNTGPISIVAQTSSDKAQAALKAISPGWSAANLARGTA